MAFYRWDRAENGMKALEIGGVEDHVHILLSLTATLPIAKAMQLIKGGSSKWVHETFPEQRRFQWRVKYGAFAASVSLLDRTISYIKSQEKQHRKVSFKEEFLALLRKHQIPFEERYLWGLNLGRPFGTGNNHGTVNPMLKHWAFLGCPSGTRNVRVRLTAAIRNTRPVPAFHPFLRLRFAHLPRLLPYTLCR